MVGTNINRPRACEAGVAQILQPAFHGLEAHGLLQKSLEGPRDECFQNLRRNHFEEVLLIYTG
jgi:hypothetical protein